MKAGTRSLWPLAESGIAANRFAGIPGVTRSAKVITLIEKIKLERELRQFSRPLSPPERPCLLFVSLFTPNNENNEKPEHVVRREQLYRHRIGEMEHELR
jgi:hypothetical protein